ncbi:Crp/Fnr family transcriptional regulator (plasmid) [Paroceanicella profunda]|uniref:Crp/Fnr family transcriptional regulator n=1 Tax=Paroceanicella profunda TaxID=2579971 RepID=A0A5B8FJW7_9RHOB|nr:Crp/Fnr family transcriptional regulator [Paroceanicella profunda]QDL94957.1 Crp/Fnr family transcriptional regulator [Paroceanicella profunda]
MTMRDLDAALAFAATRGWFSTLAADTREKLSGIARLQRFAAREIVFSFGDPADGVFGLVEGSFEITIPRADGLGISAYRADPGHWIGDPVRFDGQTRLVTLIAAGPARALFLPDPDLRALLADDPDLLGEFCRLNHLNTALALRLLANLVSPPSEARIALHLLMQDEARAPGARDIGLSQGRLAEGVALSAPTVERVLRRMQEKGMIDLCCGRIRILDRDALRALSGR